MNIVIFEEETGIVIGCVSPNEEDSFLKKGLAFRVYEDDQEPMFAEFIDENGVHGVKMCNNILKFRKL